MRRKANKADEYFIESHSLMSSEEISKEIDLSITVVDKIKASLKATPILKSTRIKGHDGVSVLSPQAADHIPSPRKIDSEYVYRPKK